MSAGAGGTERGGRRATQARLTRRRIVDAAQELFERQGYAATTLDQIAAAAEVAVQTVYFHFGNKATVLKELVDVLAGGDDDPVSLLDRPWVQRIRDEPDGKRALALWLANSRAIFTRVAPIMKIVRDAAGADPAMARQWETNERQRHTVHTELARLLADRHALRPDVSVQDAADIIYTIISQEVFALLTRERGWTPKRWERWAASTLTATLLE